MSLQAALPLTPLEAGENHAAWHSSLPVRRLGIQRGPGTSLGPVGWPECSTGGCLTWQHVVAAHNVTLQDVISLTTLVCAY